MLLDVRRLQVRFHQRGRVIHAVNGVDLQLQEGDALAVVGESGAGKSQALLALTGLVPRSAKVSGQAWFEGEELLALPEARRRHVRGGRIAYVFQDAMSALNPYLRIGTQLGEVLALHRGLTGTRARDAMIDMLDRVRIPDPGARLAQYPHQLSGGQRQRVMLAMALLGQPRLIIADEPTTALDVTVQRKVLDLLAELRRELKFSLIIVTHDLGVAKHVANRIAVMYAGRVVESGPLQAVFEDPRHPYTRALLAAAPRPHGPPPSPIPGQPPRLDHVPEGCAFAARCPQVRNACQQAIAEHEFADGRRVACIHGARDD